MRRKTVLSACFLALLLSFSFTAVVLAESSLLPHLPLIQDDQGPNRLFFSSVLLLGTGLHDPSGLLNQSTRMEIHNFVKVNPGVHFRGICSDLGLSIGVVQYHLDILVDARKLLAYQDGQYVRYFEFGIFNESERNLISLLRHDQQNRILTALVENGSILHKDLAHALGVSSQALTWQMTNLKSLNIVDAIKEGMSVKYQLNNETKIALGQCLGIVNKA